MTTEQHPTATAGSVTVTDIMTGETKTVALMTYEEFLAAVAELPEPPSVTTIGAKVMDGAGTTGTVLAVSEPTTLYVTSASGVARGSVVDHLVTVDFDAHDFGKGGVMRGGVAIAHSIDLVLAPPA
jgi:hypothetical protein